MAVLPPPSLRAAIRPVCRRSGCAEDAFYAAGFCFACGLRYLNWRAARDRLEALDLAVGGHPPHAELDDDPAFAAALDLLYLHLFRGPFE